MNTFYSKTYRILICFVFLFLIISCSSDEDSSDTTGDDVSVDVSGDDDTDGNSNDNEDVDDEEQAMADEILRLVNEHRRSIDLNKLRYNKLANRLAKKHTLYMIEEEAISHDDFDDRSNELMNKANAVSTGENVASYQRTAQEVMNDWLDSQGHRDNIEGNFTHIGISAIKNDNGIYYFTQLFLRK